MIKMLFCLRGDRRSAPQSAGIQPGKGFEEQFRIPLHDQLRGSAYKGWMCLLLQPMLHDTLPKSHV